MLAGGLPTPKRWSMASFAGSHCTVIYMKSIGRIIRKDMVVNVTHLEATLKVILNGQSYLYGRLRQLEGELYGQALVLEDVMAEWDQETIKQIEELCSDQ